MQCTTCESEAFYVCGERAFCDGCYQKNRRTDLNPAESKQLDDALLTLKWDKELREEGRGFCMGSAAKAQKILEKFTA